MGRDKASLPFGDETMLQRVVRLLSTVVPVGRIVVVGAQDQVLPALPPEVTVARDHHSARGPLEGLAAGLRAMPRDVDAVYATSCDVPLLQPAFVEYLFGQLGDHNIAVPIDGEFHHPLAAVYRPSVLKTVEELLATDRLRPRFLFDEVATREIPVDLLRAVDPDLRTLANLNHLEEYEQARKAAGVD
jgi:molybdopterin-guanine dinucleotide biosynthesis protein A